MKTKNYHSTISIGGVALRSPVLLASGTCGYGDELLGHVNYRKIGGLVAKSITLKPRAGNPMPRIVECHSGMLNAIGLANVGLETFCREKLPAMRKLPCAIIANVAGSTEEEYLQVARTIDRETGVAGIELNLSCPNVHAGGIEFGKDPKTLGKLVAAVRRQVRKPLWIKLSPNVTDIVPLAQAAEDNGANALTVINTLIGMRFDIEKQKPILANRTGGLSGPAIKPVALHMVYKVFAAVKIPVIGCGGIETASDALEFILAGASAVQIGTGTFREPQTAEEISQGIEHYLKRKSIKNMNALIGAGHQ